jgi:hypothetical protein
LIELPLYLCAVWWLTAIKGVEGTAIAWAGRFVVDTLLIGFVIERVFCHRWFLTKLVVTMLVGLLFLYLGALPASLVMKAGSLSIGMVVFSLVVWFLVLSPGERRLLASESLDADTR